MKNKVFLFETATEEQNKIRGETVEKSIQYPIGLMYLSSTLKQNGYETLIKDYTYWTEERCLEEIKKEIDSFKPEFVGIAVMTMTRVSTYKAIKLIKSINPEIKIILGGIHASVMYKQLMENFSIDAICIGEAEESLVKVLDAMRSKKPMDNIKGIAFKKNNKVVVTKKLELNTNLSDLPFPDYDAYMNHSIKTVFINTSRGCPNKCSFCCLHIVSRQVWRPRDPMKVVDEIEFINKKYPWVDRINILDDTFPLDNERVIKICKEIIKRKINLKFQCQGRIKPVSREMFYWMEKAGFDQIGFGIETGSKTLLASIHKGITAEDCINTFNLLKEFKKLNAAKFMMVGFPGETEETVNETIELIKTLNKIKPATYFCPSPLQVLPGTEIYENAKSKGWIDDSYWLTDKPCPYFTLEHPKKWLIKMQNKMAIEPMLAQGKIFFLKRAIRNFIRSPKYYFKRIINF